MLLHDKQVQAVAFGGHLAPGENLAKGIGAGAVDGTAVGADPSACFHQQFLLKGHQAAVGARTYVEQEIPASANDMHQVSDFLVHFRLQRSTLLPAAVAPRFPENRGGCLPGHGQVVVGDLVVGHHTKIAKVVAQPSAHIHPGCNSVTNWYSSRLCSTVREPIPTRDRSVAGQNFYLTQVQAVCSGVMDRRCDRTWIGLRKMPVDERKIHAGHTPSRQAVSSPIASRAVRCRLHNIERRIGRVVHADVVVLDRKDNRAQWLSWPPPPLCGSHCMGLN